MNKLPVGWSFCKAPYHLYLVRIAEGGRGQRILVVRPLIDRLFIASDQYIKISLTQRITTGTGGRRDEFRVSKGL